MWLGRASERDESVQELDSVSGRRRGACGMWGRRAGW